MLLMIDEDLHLMRQKSVLQAIWMRLNQQFSRLVCITTLCRAAWEATFNEPSTLFVCVMALSVVVFVEAEEMH